MSSLPAAFPASSIAVAASRLAAQRGGNDRAFSGFQLAASLAAAAALCLLTTTGAGAGFAGLFHFGSVNSFNQAVSTALPFDHLAGVINAALR